MKQNSLNIETGVSTLKEVIDNYPNKKVQVLKKRLLAALGKSKTTLNDYIYGYKLPTAADQKAINKATGLELDYLTPYKQHLKRQTKRVNAIQKASLPKPQPQPAIQA